MFHKNFQENQHEVRPSSKKQGTTLPYNDALLNVPKNRYKPLGYSINEVTHFDAF
jgi:hypothetical protein